MIRERKEYCLLLLQNNNMENKSPKMQSVTGLKHYQYYSPVPKNHTRWSTIHPVCVLLFKTMQAFVKRNQDRHVGVKNIAPTFRFQNYLSNIGCGIFLRVDFGADSTPSPPAFHHRVGWRRRDFILPRISTSAYFLQILNLFCLFLKTSTGL